MANRVTFSKLALADLDSIAEYVALDSATAADRLMQEIRERCQRLGAFPDVGIEVRPGTRRIVVGSYLVFYRSRPDRVQIVRILHGARQVPRNLGG